MAQSSISVVNKCDKHGEFDWAWPIVDSFNSLSWMIIYDEYLQNNYDIVMMQVSLVLQH